jgi:carbamoyltransferase
LKNILGISGYYHDSAAALLCDGKIVAAAQEERFTRKKHDPSFPKNAIIYCLQEASLSFDDLDIAVFYDDPYLKFDRLLKTYLAYAPQGVESFIPAMSSWVSKKLFFKSLLKEEFDSLTVRGKTPKLLFCKHHQSHAASAFYPSPFERAAVICIDGVGEWASTSVWHGEGNKLTSEWELKFPHSLGLLYSAFTYYSGFKVNSGEYKLMGLAPYGEPKYVNLILDNLVDLKEDGSFRLNMAYFNFPAGLTMINEKFEKLMKMPRRQPESGMQQHYMDVAHSIQKVTEKIVLKIAESTYKKLGVDSLCLAGGVALNCVANGRVLKESPFKHIWI